MNIKFKYIISLNVFFALTGMLCQSAGWGEQLKDVAARSWYSISGNASLNKELLDAVREPRAGEIPVANKVKRALDYGADPNTVDDIGNTPLMLAAENGYLMALSKLIVAGANIFATNDRGETALMLAAAYHQEMIVQRLLRPKLAITKEEINRTNELGLTALSMAAAAGIGNEEIIAQLLVAGASPDVIDKLGFTPLMHAVVTNYVPAVRTLLEGGADITIANSHFQNQSTALDFAILNLNNALLHNDIASQNNANAIIELLTMGG